MGYILTAIHISRYYEVFNQACDRKPDKNQQQEFEQRNYIIGISDGSKSDNEMAQE